MTENRGTTRPLNVRTTLNTSNMADRSVTPDSEADNGQKSNDAETLLINTDRRIKSRDNSMKYSCIKALND